MIRFVGKLRPELGEALSRGFFKGHRPETPVQK